MLRVHNTVNPTTCILHNCLMKNSHSQIYFIFDKNIQRICIEPDHFHHIPNIFSLEDIMFHIAQRKRERARDTEMSICKRISFIFGLAFHFVLCHISAFCGIWMGKKKKCHRKIIVHASSQKAAYWKILTANTIKIHAFILLFLVLFVYFLVCSFVHSLVGLWSIFSFLFSLSFLLFAHVMPCHFFVSSLRLLDIT